MIMLYAYYYKEYRNNLNDLVYNEQIDLKMALPFHIAAYYIRFWEQH